MIFQLLARLGLDTTEFSAGVKRATTDMDKLKSDIQKRNASFGGSFAKVGASIAAAFSFAAIGQFAKMASETVGTIKDMSDLLGTSYEETQKLGYAAKSAGLSFDFVVGAMQQIENQKTRAMAGDKSANALFAALGIDPSQSALEILKRAVESSRRGVNENAAAVQLLGEKVGKLKMLVKELNEQPKISLISNEEIEAIDAANKSAEKAIYNLKTAVVSGAGRGVQRMQRIGMLFDASEAAGVYADATGLKGDELQSARRAFTLDIYKRMNEQAGFSTGSSPMSVGGSTAGVAKDETLQALYNLTQEAKRTADAVESATKQ